MIWNVADMLRGPFKPHEYGLVILPMTVVKRFQDCLLPTHKAVFFWSAIESALLHQSIPRRILQAHPL